MNKRRTRIISGEIPLRSRALWAIRSLSYIDRNASAWPSACLIAGSARSGTTWVGDVVARAFNDRVIFEPLHPQHVRMLAEYPSRIYRERSAVDPELLGLLERIVSGRIRNSWVDQQVGFGLYSGRTIKEVRGNLLLPFVVENFPTLPTFLLVRDPFKVAKSRLSLGGGSPVEEILEQVSGTRSAIPQDAVPLLKGLYGEWERAIAMWCIENYVPISQTTADELTVVSFEMLRSEPATEFDNMFSVIGRKRSNRKRLDPRRPSRMSVMPNIDPRSLSIDGREMKSVRGILSAFGMNDLLEPSGDFNRSRLTELRGSRRPGGG